MRKLNATQPNHSQAWSLRVQAHESSVSFACVQAVYGMGSMLVKVGQLDTRGAIRIIKRVYDSMSYAQPQTQLLRATIHKMCSVFSPVMSDFMLNFHSPYNKQRQII